MLSHDERVTVALRPPALTRTHSPSACRRHPIVSCASVSAGVCMSSSLSGAPRRTRCRHCAIVLRAGRVARHLATLRASVSSRTCALAGAKEGAVRTLRTAKEAWAFDRRGCEKLQNQTSFQLVSNFKLFLLFCVHSTCLFQWDIIDLPLIFPRYMQTPEPTYSTHAHTHTRTHIFRIYMQNQLAKMCDK